MAGYTRQSTYTDGDIIQAADSNNEFDQLLAAFNEATGHSHDGTSAEGPVIGLIGDAGETTPLNKIVVDTANNRVSLFVDVGGSAVEQVRFQDGAFVPVTDDDVDLGASGAEFKDLYLDGTANIDTLVIGSSTGVTSVDTDISSVSASDDTLASAKAIKTYVDAQVTAQDLDLTSDSGTIAIDLDSETLTVAGGTGLDSSAAGNTVTLAIDSTVATLAGTQTLTNKTVDLTDNTVTGTLAEFNTAVSDATLASLAGSETLTNKTIDADNNTISNLEVDNLKSGVLDTDISTVSGSDDTLASAKAIKTYVDAQVTAQDLDVTSDSGTIAIDLDSETLTVAGGTGLDSSATGNTVTLAIDSTVATLTGTQTLTNKTINGPDNTLTNIANASLANSSVTVNSNSVSLGGSVTLDTDDIGEGSTNLYFTNTRADDRITAATGVSVQAYDAGLTSIAGLTTAADKIIYTTASDTYAVTDFTAFGRSLIDDADASAGRTTLGLGTAAVLDVGTSANNVVQLDGSGALPAVDGSNLTNINFTESDPSALAFAIALG